MIVAVKLGVNYSHFVLYWLFFYQMVIEGYILLGPELVFLSGVFDTSWRNVSPYEAFEMRNMHHLCVPLNIFVRFCTKIVIWL